MPTIQTTFSITIATFVLFAVVSIGCQSSTTNPWEGTAYQSPQDHLNPPQATYAPMPTLLPRVAAESVAPVSQDDELESVLMDLQSIESEFDSFQK